jgi:hypothetical protein
MGRTGFREVAGAIVDVAAPGPHGQQDLERLPEQHRARVAEHALARGIHQRDAAGLVDQDDAFGGRLQHRLGHGLARAKGRPRLSRLALPLLLRALVSGGAGFHLGHAAAQPHQLGGSGRPGVSVVHGPTISGTGDSVKRGQFCPAPDHY